MKDETKVMTGGKVRANSFDGRLRKRLGLPSKQLVYYSDANDKNSREDVTEWEIRKASLDGYALIVRTKNREVQLHSFFLAMMQEKNFIREWARLSQAKSSMAAE